jgi:hypothetical protein
MLKSESPSTEVAKSESSSAEVANSESSRSDRNHTQVRSPVAKSEGNGQKNPNCHSIHRVKSCEKQGMNPVSLSPPSRIGLRRQGRRGIKQLQIHAKE